MATNHESQNRQIRSVMGGRQLSPQSKAAPAVWQMDRNARVVYDWLYECDK